MKSVAYNDEIPKSHHSIFIRGFPASMDVRKIRDFFEKASGHCTVDFFKTSADKAVLFIAVRFDTHDVAKDMMNKYNRKEVLGHIISMDWFKDVKRFNSHNEGRGGIRNNNSFQYRGSSSFTPRGIPGSRPFFRGRGRVKYSTPQFNTHPPFPIKNDWAVRPNPRPMFSPPFIRGLGRHHIFRHETKRSRSPSSSRSRSRSPRSRSRSYDDDERYRKTTRRRRSRTRSLSSHSKSSYSRDSKSSGYGPRTPPHRTPDDERHSKASRSRDDSEPELASRSRSSSKHDQKHNAQMEGKGILTPEHLDDMTKKHHIAQLPNNQGPKKRYLIENKPDEILNANYFEWNQYNSGYGMSSNVVTPTSAKQFFSQAQPLHSLPPKLRYFQDVNAIPIMSDMIGHQQHILPTEPCQTITPPYMITQMPKSCSLKPRSMSEIEKAVNDEYNLNKKMPSEEKTIDQNFVPVVVPIDSINGKVQNGSHYSRQRLIVEAISPDRLSPIANNKPVASNKGQEIGRENIIQENNSVIIEYQTGVDGSLEKSSNVQEENIQQKFSCNVISADNVQVKRKTPMQSKAMKGIAEISDMIVQNVLTEITPVLQKKTAAAEKDENLTETNNAILKNLQKNYQLLSEQAKKVVSSSDRRNKINNLKPEQVDMLQRKRQELEQSYRQDCETFATVVKMLISKDPSLEDKIVNSLRESLKDIGEKFIEELSAFIDDLLASQES